jgi:hypothetical protein
MRVRKEALSHCAGLTARGTVRQALSGTAVEEALGALRNRKGNGSAVLLRASAHPAWPVKHRNLIVHGEGGKRNPCSSGCGPTAKHMGISTSLSSALWSVVRCRYPTRVRLMLHQAEAVGPRCSYEGCAVGTVEDVPHSHDDIQNRVVYKTRLRVCDRPAMRIRGGSPHQVRPGSLAHGFRFERPTKLLISVAARQLGSGDLGTSKAREYKRLH